MTLTDFVWVAVGETLLAGTFALGILVGISLTKRISNDNDTGKAGTAGKDFGWYHAGNGGTAAGNGDGKGGGRQR
jgi:hypothetical protein